MSVLVLGGTRFVGRHVVEALVAAGHAVTVLNRGRTPDDLPAAVERLRGDRNGGAAGLGALEGRTWDACVDVNGYMPAQVRPAVEALHGRVGRYVFVSTVSVYGDLDDGPVLETYPRMAPAPDHETEITGETYGPLKVACEDLIEARFGRQSALLRPQIVAGPHDPTGRYPYWVQRARQGGDMLAPGDGSDHLQVVDARDVARFVVSVVERDLDGAYNLAGPRLTWAAFLALLAPDHCVWVPAEMLWAAGLTFQELPLFRSGPGHRGGLMNVSAERATQAGLQLAAPADTLTAVQTWLEGRDEPPALAPHIEAALVAAARAQR